MCCYSQCDGIKGQLPARRGEPARAGSEVVSDTVSGVCEHETKTSQASLDNIHTHTHAHTSRLWGYLSTGPQPGRGLGHRVIESMLEIDSVSALDPPVSSSNFPPKTGFLHFFFFAPASGMSVRLPQHSPSGRAGHLAQTRQPRLRRSPSQQSRQFQQPRAQGRK